MKKSELESFIKEVVQKEVKKHISTILPLMINDVLTYKLSKKTVSLNESLDRSDDDDAEWPTIQTTKKPNILTTAGIKELVGFPEKPNRSEIKIHSPKSFVSVTEYGTPIEVPADSVPDHVKSALVRDYSSLVKAWNKKEK